MKIYMVARCYDDSCDYATHRNVACFANRKDALDWAINQAEKDAKEHPDDYDEDLEVNVDEKEKIVEAAGRLYDDLWFEIEEWEVQ